MLFGAFFPAGLRNRYRFLLSGWEGQADPLSQEQQPQQEISPFGEMAARHCRQNFRPIKKAQSTTIVKTIIFSIILLC